MIRCCPMADWLTRDALDRLSDGIVITVGLTAITTVLALLLGGLLASARQSRSRGVRRASGAFVDVFRNVPALVLIIFFAFAVPTVVPQSRRTGLFFDNWLWDALNEMTGIPIPYYAVAATVALVANTGAHLAEVIRGGLSTVPSEEIESARLLGAGRLRVWRSVTFPGALRSSFPAVSSRLIHNMKNTALASLVAVPELFHSMQGEIARSFRATEFLTLVALVYLGLAAVFSMTLERVETHLLRGRRG